MKAAGLSVREEIGVDCCHANQDKFWVEDPDGVEWEVYVLNHDLDETRTRGADAVVGIPLPLVEGGGGCCIGTPAS